MVLIQIFAEDYQSAIPCTDINYTNGFVLCQSSEVQQFRKEVRESPEVDFAVQAFAALNSNNFVRFFKLVSAASYLSSCILHRYFNQVNASDLTQRVVQ